LIRTARRKLIALLACVALAAAAPACNRSTSGNPSDEGTAAAGPRQIVALGRLEPFSGIRDIGTVPGDAVQEFASGVEEGALVQAGAELARLKSFGLRATQLEAAELKLELGQQQREQELSVARTSYGQALAAKAEVDAKLEEISAQGEALTNLEESAQIAQADYDSLVALQASDPELVTEQQLRRQRNEVDQAVNQYEMRARSQAAGYKAAYAAVEAAQENVRSAQLSLELAEDTNRNQIAEIERRVAEETLEQSLLRAPNAEADGSEQFTVLKIYLEPGEFVSQLPVLQVGDLTRMVCVAEVYEADVKELVEGQEATIRSPAFSGEFADGDATGNGGGMRGKVIRVGSLVSSAGLMQRNPLAPSDRSIVEVRIEITGKDAAELSRATAEAARHIGLQVTVHFGKKPSSAPPSSGGNSDAAGAEASNEGEAS
jgi:HlyD family secretion protein